MSTRDIDPQTVLVVQDLGFGPEVTTLTHSSVSICAPCYDHDGRYRRASYTGAKSLNFLDPNLCPTHKQAFDAELVWDRSLGPAGRPRVVGLCSFNGCDSTIRAKGFCTAHYFAARRAARRVNRG